jgi:hypothetical protein
MPAGPMIERPGSKASLGTGTPLARHPSATARAMPSAIRSMGSGSSAEV